jgi:hypothetical protein
MIKESTKKIGELFVRINKQKTESRAPWERQFPHWHTSRQRQRVDVEPWCDVKTWVHKERGSQKRAVMPHPRQYLPRIIIRCLPMWKLAFPGKYQTVLCLCRADGITQQRHKTRRKAIILLIVFPIWIPVFFALLWLNALTGGPGRKKNRNDGGGWSRDPLRDFRDLAVFGDGENRDIPC